jgi:hypothetical protein
VKYCSDDIFQNNNHREQHDEECRKRRRAKLRGKDLFTLPEGKPLGRVSDTICCVFAFTSVALDERKCTFMGYCPGEIEVKGLERRCAFCREP